MTTAARCDVMCLFWVSGLLSGFSCAAVLEARWAVAAFAVAVAAAACFGFVGWLTLKEESGT
jgi:hypothetical protein